jgi:hypothetical protein
VLKVILYDRAQDLYQLDFLENPELPLTYVFPHPQLADDFRDRFNDLGLLENREVITISNFIKGQLQDVENFKGKAQLIPCLIPEWKKRIENPTFEKFLHTFNLFTDLRSFTLNFDLITDILTEFDKDLAKGLLIFWNELETEGIVDEHKAYNLISQMDFSGEKKNLFFWGFGHLSALQIEMLQALSTYHDVYVPFPRNAFIKSHSTDWINWVDTSLVNDLKEVPRVLRGKFSLFPKNKMSEYLREKLDKKKTDFYLMSKDISMEDINEIPQAGLNFKVKNDLYKNKIKDIFTLIKEGGATSKDDLEKEIEKLIGGEREKDFGLKDFRRLKIYLLIKEILSEWPDTEISLFDLRVMEYLIDLNAPRTFSTPILASDEFGEIRGINRLGFYNSQNQKVICVNSNYAPIKTSGSRYPELVEEFLRALGPIQNNYMEYLQIKEHILEILEEENSLFFLEEGLQDSDLAWEEIFFEIKDNQLGQGKDKKELTTPVDYLLPFVKKEAAPLKSISAKKLQTYIDCPRKYYFSYPEKINPYISPTCTITPADLGRIEHEVMDYYFREYRTWDPVNHENTVKAVFERHLMKKAVPELKIKTAWVEVKHYTQNGILEILKLLTIYPDATLEFEKELSEDHVKGFIDLVFVSSEGVGLIDFKRSKGGMATKGELLSFKEIQLWFYLNHLKQEGKILFLGYLGMGHPDDSIFLVRDELLKDKLNSESFCSSKRIYVAENTLEEELKNYSHVEDRVIKEIKEENTWSARPLSSDSCKYCVVETVCPKGEL